MLAGEATMCSKVKEPAKFVDLWGYEKEAKKDEFGLLFIFSEVLVVSVCSIFWLVRLVSWPTHYYICTVGS